MERVEHAVSVRRSDRHEESTAEDELPGQHVGPYELLEKIGAGGMGAVWRARRADKRPDRVVALKLIRRGTPSRSAEQRFRLEEQVLSRLSHPHIATLFDCGVSASGRPYLIMEYVEGESILEYAERRVLSIEQRLSLFQQVCSAVQYAHGALVLHRDIKPGNILVAADGSAKLLDFGIAKLLDDEVAPGMTATDVRLLTPRYASPEQVQGHRLTTASDQYSLAVVLFELLTGQSPYRLETGTRAEIERAVLEQEVRRPSSMVSADATAPRGHRVLARLQGDLDTILIKALQKDPLRRYPSVGHLAADIDRHLNGLPISAAPDSLGYRASRFVARNKGLVAGMITALVALLAATAVSTSYALREARARGEAEKRAGELAQVAAFQELQLSGVEPEVMGAGLRKAILERQQLALDRSGTEGADEIAALERLSQSLVGVNFTDVALKLLQENIFQRAVSAADQEFDDQPLVHARLLQAIASTLHELGMFNEATDPQAEALRLRRDTLGDNHVDTLASMVSLGSLLAAQAKLPEAEAALRAAAIRCRQVLGADHPHTLKADYTLGSLLTTMGSLGDAETQLTQTLQDCRRVLGNDHRQTLLTLLAVGNVYLAQGRLGDAELMLREAADSQRRLLGPTHSDTLGSINNLAATLKEQGKFAEAETYYREAVEGYRTLLGDDHPDTLRAIINLGSLYQVQGRIDEAEPYYREALDGTRMALGKDHPLTLTATNNMGHFLQSQRKLTEAEPYVREVLESARLVFGEDHANTLTCLNNLGALLRELGRPAEAEPYYRQALEGRRRVLGDDHFNSLFSISIMGVLMRELKRYEESVALGEEAIRRGRTALPAGHWALGGFLSSHAATLMELGRLDEAEAAALEGYQVLIDTVGEKHYLTIGCVKLLVKLYKRMENEERAAHWKQVLNPEESAQGQGE